MNLSNLRYYLAGSAVLLVFSGPAAAAGSAEALLRAMEGCAAVGDRQERLACYDRLAPQVKDALANPAPPPVASVPPPPVASAQPPAAAPSHAPTEEEQKSWFGFDIGDLFGTSPKTQTTPEQFGNERTVAKQQEAEANKPKEIDSITAGVTDYAYNAFGKFVVFLDNGQIWKQIPGDADRARFKRAASDNKVTVSRGFLGSYNLQINDSNKTYKVTRIK